MVVLRMLLSIGGGAFIGNAMGRQSNNRTWKARFAIGIALFVLSIVVIFFTEVGV